MGLDVYGYTILGVRIGYDNLFTNTGTKLSCVRCLHTETGAAKFCPNDGQKLSQIAVEEATPGFAAYAATQNKSPRRVFEDLRDTSKTIGIHNVNSIQGCEDSNRDCPLAIGFKIGRTESNRGGKSSPSAVTLEQANEIAEEVENFLHELGINTDKEPEIFTCTYLSY